MLPDKSAPIGLSLLTFATFLGGTVFVTVAQTLFEDRLTKGLKDILPGLDSSSIANGGATTLRNMVSQSQLAQVLEIYNESMRSIWYLGLGLSCLVFVAAWGLEWKSVRSDKNNTGGHKGQEV